MTFHPRSLGALALLALVSAWPAEAQRTAQLGPVDLTAAVPCRSLNTDGLGSASVDLRGTGSSWEVTFYVEGPNGGRNVLDMSKADTPGTFVNTATDIGLWKGDVAGYKALVACLTTVPASGTVSVALYGVGTGGGTSGGGGGGGGGGGDFDIATFQTTFGSTGLFRTASQADNVAATVDSFYTTNFNLVYDGATFDLMRGDATDGLLVNLGSNNDVTVTGTVTVTDGSGALNVIIDSSATLTVNAHAVTNAGTFATQVDGAALTALQLIDNLVAAEDAVAGSAFAGVPVLVVRQDSHSDLAADGDFIPLTVDADGGLRVSIVAGAGSGGTALADDADFTAQTTSFTPTGGFYQSSVTACTDGDTCAFGITAQRTLKATLFSAAGSELTPATDWAEDSASADGHTGPVILAVRRDTAASSTTTAGDYGTFNLDGLGRLWVRDGDPCSDPARVTYAVVNESTAATNEVVGLNGSDLIYVCSYKWVAAGATSLNWTRGTGSDCGMGTAAIEGPQAFAENGGVVESGGGHALFVVPAGNALCLVSSAGVGQGGRVSYVRTAAP